MRSIWVAVIGMALGAGGCGATVTTAPSTTTGASSGATTTSAQPLTTTTVPSGTVVATVEPFTAQGSLDTSFHVTSTRAATDCVGGGVAGSSSYRCFADSSVFDPCFAPPGAATGPVFCSSDPSRSDGAELTVSSLPAQPGGVPASRPWAVRLAGGQICVLVDAAWGGLGPFGCQPPGPLADCHTPAEGSPWWTVACQGQATESSPFTDYRVETVWT